MTTGTVHQFPAQADGSGGAPDGAAKLLDSIQRLTQIIEEETAALKNYELDRLSTFTRSKSQALLEFTRLENQANAQASSQSWKAFSKSLVKISNTSLDSSTD